MILVAKKFWNTTMLQKNSIDLYIFRNKTFVAKKNLQQDLCCKNNALPKFLQQDSCCKNFRNETFVAKIPATKPLLRKIKTYRLE